MTTPDTPRRRQSDYRVCDASAQASVSGAGAQPYHGTDRLIVGIVLAVITFWLFQTTLNVAPIIRDALGIPKS